MRYPHGRGCTHARGREVVRVRALASLACMARNWRVGGSDGAAAPFARLRPRYRSSRLACSLRCWLPWFARSLRSLACSVKVLPFSTRNVVVDALPMVARLPPHSAPFRSRPASARNRLSPAIRQAPLVVLRALASLACMAQKWRVGGSDGAAAPFARLRPRYRSSRLACSLRCWLPCPSGSALARFVLVARQSSPVRFRV